MRVLLLHPEDYPQRGPWSAQRWDLIVDLGRSSSASAAAREDMTHTPVLRTDTFRKGVEDIRQVRRLFSLGLGRLVDEEGIDWWDITSLSIAWEAEAVLVFFRMISEIDGTAEIWATRAGWPSNAVFALLKRPVQSFYQEPSARISTRVLHYGSLFRRFSAGQIKEIFLDKYDSEYKWRSRFASRAAPLREPSILLPSAYGNVSRVAAAYARLLPEEYFLLVATRQSGRLTALPPNVQTRDLATYAGGDVSTRENTGILEEWVKLKADLCAIAEFAVLSRAGVLDSFPGWFQSGLRARDAWRKVIEIEPVCGVLCGDDSNLYTRLPVMLAARRGISTADFHHGALDGGYLLKELPCDTYLAKNEMERDYLLRVCGLPPEKVELGAPAPAPSDSRQNDGPSNLARLVLFSEPYENSSLRTEEVYRDLLPPLCRVARQTGRGVVLKLHPFESLSQRTRIVRNLLPEEDFKRITVVDGPLSQRLLSNTWFGVTVESSTVLDCFVRNIPCFVCGWLTMPSFGYVEQYERFGVAQILRSAKELEEIPSLLTGLRNSPSSAGSFSKTAEPEALRRLLGVKSRTGAVAGRIS